MLKDRPKNPTCQIYSENLSFIYSYRNDISLSMADFTSGLMAIAVELQDKIFQQVLLQPDGMLRLRALSRTCSGYRSLLAPYTHRAVHLMNNVENSISVDALASGVYRDNVQELHYRGLIPRSGKYTSWSYSYSFALRRVCPISGLCHQCNSLEILGWTDAHL